MLENKDYCYFIFKMIKKTFIANLGQRSRDVSTIVRSASNFAKNWMTIASWEARVESFNDYLLDIANKLEERQYKKSKQAAKVYTIGK